MMIYDNFFTLLDLFGLLQSGPNSLKKGHTYLCTTLYDKNVLFWAVLAHFAYLIEKRE